MHYYEANEIDLVARPQDKRFPWPRFITLTTKESKFLVNELIEGNEIKLWNSKDAIKLLELLNRTYGYLCQITDEDEYLTMRTVGLIWSRN